MKIAPALLFLAAVPALALARGGDPDLNVNPTGVQQIFTATDTAYVFGRHPDGRFLHVHHDGDTLTVTRRLKDGTIDAGFGFGGTITYPRAAQVASPSVVVPLTVKAILVAPDGKIVLAGEATASCGTIGVSRLREDGTSDNVFGTNGWSAAMPSISPVGTCVDGAHFTLAAARFMPDGKIMAVGYAADPLSSRPTGRAVIGRWLPTGAPDPGYHGAGYVMPDLQWLDSPGGARIADDGSVELVHASQAAGGDWAVTSTRISADGNTTRAVTLPVPADLRAAPGVAFASVGGARLLYTRSAGSAGEISIVRMKPDDTLDAAFAGSGRARVAFPFGYDVTARPTPDNGMLFFASASEPPNDAVLMAKVDEAGYLEPSFGTDGRLAFSTTPLSEFARQVAIGPDGYVELFGYTISRVLGVERYSWYFARLQGVPDVVEFENTILKHYFIGYDDATARGIDAGAAGPGWRRTGYSFRPGGDSAVCRFYGTPGRGPNSHFYSAVPSDCDLVKQDPGWTYEGTSFYTTAPGLTGCAPGLLEVHRLYNNRAAQNDTNHRYIVYPALAAGMVADGWIYEGVVFCTVR